MYGVYGEIKLFIPGSESLKDRRRVVKSLHDRLHKLCNASVADTSKDETWQTASLTFAIVASNMTGLNDMLECVDNQVNRHSAEFEVISFEYDYFPERSQY